VTHFVDSDAFRQASRRITAKLDRLKSKRCLTLATGNARAALRERRDDLYETPAVAVEALLEHERLPVVIWEPACGPGAIVKVLRRHGHTVVATNLDDYGCPDSTSRVDFLMEHRVPDRVEAIVTNPPFKLAHQFMRHALFLCPRVIMLGRLAWLESERRRDVLENAGLARVHVFSRRIPMMHRHGWNGRRIGNSGMAFGWFVWDQAHCGPATVQRISWRDLPADNTAPPVDYDAADDFEKSINACYGAVRERMANGGPGWPQGT
jgi:hypothetical protein